MYNSGFPARQTARQITFLSPAHEYIVAAAMRHK